MFLTYLRRELRRRTRQTLVVVLGLAIGIGLVITVNAASSGVAAAQSQVLSSLYGVGTDITVIQRVEPGQRGAGPAPFDFGSGDTTSDVVTQDRLMLGGGLTALAATTIATVAEQPHVSRAVGSLALTDLTVTGNFAPPEQGPVPGAGPGGGGLRPQIDVTSFSINGVDVTALDVGPLSSSSLTDGRAFTAGDATAPVALLSATYANEQGLAVGDTLTIAGTEITIVGIVSSPTGDTVNVYLPLGTAQALSGQTDKVTTIYVQATSAQDVVAAQAEIQAALPEATVSTASDLAEQISGSLTSAADLADNLGRWLSIVVLVAAFAVAALLTMSGVSRRVREFGTLKALGWRGRRIVGQVMGESLVHGLLGGALGIGLGVLGALLVSSLAPELTATVTPGFNGPGGGVVGPPGSANGGFAGGPAGGPAALPGAAPDGPGPAFRAVSTVAVQLSAPVTMTAIGLAVGLALAGGLVAGGFGAWRVSRLRPADALRRID